MTVVMSVCIISSVPGTVWSHQGDAVTSTGDSCLMVLTPHTAQYTLRSSEVEHQSQSRASVGSCPKWWTVGEGGTGMGKDELED